MPYNRSLIVALRNEKGSYNLLSTFQAAITIVALRNEKGSYNAAVGLLCVVRIVALRNEKGSYNEAQPTPEPPQHCSTAKWERELQRFVR